MFFFCSSFASLDRNEPGNLVYLKHLTRENKRSGSLESSSDSGFWWRWTYFLLPPLRGLW